MFMLGIYVNTPFRSIEPLYEQTPTASYAYAAHQYVLHATSDTMVR